jgi:hypothetical protein
MAAEPEPPFTLQELVELNELELNDRGKTEHDIARSLRARLNGLRARQGTSEGLDRRETASLQTRLTAVENEVRQLRELIKGWQKNG